MRNTLLAAAAALALAAAAPAFANTVDTSDLGPVSGVTADYSNVGSSSYGPVTLSPKAPQARASNAAAAKAGMSWTFLGQTPGVGPHRSLATEDATNGPRG